MGVFTRAEQRKREAEQKRQEYVDRYGLQEQAKKANAFPDKVVEKRKGK
jgi:hypothetical protein